MTTQANIEIYSGSYCPYCSRAKALLKKLGATFTEYDVQTDPTMLDTMLSRSNGARTIPQIFINNQHIGGCDDLYALNKTGKLERLLQQQPV
ncbi:MAG: glutaredoxin 3 [Mariprofundales bacterium]|nr:glutaredoxin 3 [Mariprofundales bacterium]